MTTLESSDSCKRKDSGGDETGKDKSEKVNSGSFSLGEVVQSEDYSRRIKLADTKKRKWAVNFGYLGSQYQGLQMNPQANTVEKHLERALFLAGSINEANFTDLHKIQWTRTARTDRGVHAVMQCCAMKLLVPLDERDLFVSNANSFLPPDIKIHSLSKVTKGFNSKLQCTKRRYHYLLPTYMLQDKSTTISALNAALLAQGRVTDAGLSGGYADPGSDKFLGYAALLDAKNVLIGYRLEAERLDTFRKALKCYEGTRKYHNFTSNKHPSDPSSSRYVLSFTCGEPFIDTTTGSEWISLSVLGQSFLLNQIRKMIGLACEVAAGHASLRTLTDAMADRKVDVPMAPGLGLYLDEVFFDNYNNNQTKLVLLHNEKVSPASDSVVATEALNENCDPSGVPTEVPCDIPAANDAEVEAEVEAEAEAETDNEPSIGEPIGWTADPTVSAAMTAFREGAVWPHILQQAESTLEFLYYLDCLRVHPHNYQVSDFKPQQQQRKSSDSRHGAGGRGRGKGNQEWNKRKKQKTEGAVTDSIAASNISGKTSISAPVKI